MSDNDEEIQGTPTTPLARTPPRNLFPASKITRFKRCIRRAQNMATDSPLALSIVSVSKSFMETYPILDDSTEPIPSDKDELLQELIQPLPENNRIFSREYFNMPLAPIGLLRDIASLYDLPNNSAERIATLDLDPNDLDNHSLLLHLWMATIMGRPTSVLQTIVQPGFSCH